MLHYGKVTTMQVNSIRLNDHVQIQHEQNSYHLVEIK